MTDRDALLMAIVADPGDSTARGALADLLDEHGEHDKATGLRTPGHWCMVAISLEKRCLFWSGCWAAIFTLPPGPMVCRQCRSAPVPLRADYGEWRCASCHFLRSRRDESSGWHAAPVRAVQQHGIIADDL